MKAILVAFAKSPLLVALGTTLAGLILLLIGRQLAYLSLPVALSVTFLVLVVVFLGSYLGLRLGRAAEHQPEITAARSVAVARERSALIESTAAGSSPERKPAAKEDPKERFRLLDDLPICIMIVKPGGEICYRNRTAERLFAKLSQWLPLEVDSIIGASYYVFHLDADAIRSVFEDPTKLPYKSELTIGSEIIETYAISVHQKPSEPSGTLVTWREVTYDRNQQRWNLLVEEQIQDASHHLTNTSRELQNIYQQMKILAEQTVSQAQDVSDFAHQSSEQINQIAAAIQQTSQTIRSIAEKVEQSSSIAQNALTEVQNANEIITELSNTSTEIRKMVQMIEQIMEQTRMLALNATIEAIGAGSAGVGFKVIADEVRDISRETSNVARGIINMIEQMMQKIPSSVKSMQTVQTVIVQMNEITLSISKEMQSQTDNVETVKNNMNEADTKSRQIVERMKAIESQSQDTKEQVNKGFETTNEIEKIDETFRIISKRFGEERIVTPNDIYRMNQIINRLFDALLEKMNPQGYAKARELSQLRFTDKQPRDVLKKSIAAAKEFLRRMELPEEKIDFPGGQVTPTQTYNFLDQFLRLLEKTLTDVGITDVATLSKAGPVDGKTPNDAFASIELAYRKLQYL
jgi:hypothetical protein